MTCRNCGHTPHQHDDRGCKVIIQSHWSEPEQRFRGIRSCACDEYAEKATTVTDNCPLTGATHEVAEKLSPNCVHCGRVVIENTR